MQKFNKNVKATKRITLSLRPTTIIKLKKTAELMSKLYRSDISINLVAELTILETDVIEGLEKLMQQQEERAQVYRKKKRQVFIDAVRC